MNCNAQNLELSEPVKLSPRGLPGVLIGKEWVSVDYACQLPGRFHWYVDFPNGESIRQMTPPVPSGRAVSLQAALASVLYCMSQSGVPGIASYLKLPFGVARWAVDHHPELMRAVNTINNSLHAGQAVIREPGERATAVREPEPEPIPVSVCNRDCE